MMSARRPAVVATPRHHDKLQPNKWPPKATIPLQGYFTPAGICRATLRAESCCVDLGDPRFHLGDRGWVRFGDVIVLPVGSDVKLNRQPLIQSAVVSQSPGLVVVFGKCGPVQMASANVPRRSLRSPTIKPSTVVGK